MARLPAARTRSTSRPILKGTPGCLWRRAKPIPCAPGGGARCLAPKAVKLDRARLEQSGASSHRSPGQHAQRPPTHSLPIAQGEQEGRLVDLHEEREHASLRVFVGELDAVAGARCGLLHGGDPRLSFESIDQLGHHPRRNRCVRTSRRTRTSDWAFRRREPFHPGLASHGAQGLRHHPGAGARAAPEQSGPSPPLPLPPWLYRNL
jgi:hypothetical protein